MAEENGAAKESRRKIKTREQIEKAIKEIVSVTRAERVADVVNVLATDAPWLGTDAAEVAGAAVAEQDEAKAARVVMTLEWVIGDGDLPGC